MAVTTNRIAAMRALERSCAQECVECAIGLLESGISTRNIDVLAGMTPPFNPFAMAALRDRVLEDLKAPDLPRELAVITYARELAADAFASVSSPFLSLQELSHLCSDVGYMKELYKCYLLANACEDLLVRGIQWYWDDVTLENIETVVREELARLALSLVATSSG
jgi:hypothetical protein